MKALFENTGLPPAFAVRGFMLDVSRDKVPTFASLVALVDLLARLRYNQFQLYIEHTFAYDGHEAVWRDASPLTPEEIRALDTRCRGLGIDLVPNQNSFGHMERWLKHDAYAALAEDSVRRLTLCPIDPAAVAHMRGLYKQLLPNFTSKLFNIGCDETWELGEGRSRPACEIHGKGRVYLDYLLQLFAAAREHGKTPLFWGDIILKFPELIPELPKDIIALQWGYAHDEPREADSRCFAEAGVPFYICPGTSGWNSIIGRAEDLLPNLGNAARLGVQYGAAGFLVTDWGDNGHWQHWPVSLPGLVGGAIAAWTGKAPDAEELAAAISVILNDSTGDSGKALIALQQAQAASGFRVHNKSLAHVLLQSPGDPLPAALSDQSLVAVEAGVSSAVRLWKAAQLNSPDARLMNREILHGAALTGFALKLGRARLARQGAISNIPAPDRKDFCNALEELIAEQRQIWLDRNRPGGLEQSIARFAPLLTALKS